MTNGWGGRVASLPGIFDTYSSSSPIIRSVSSESIAVRASDNHSWPAQDRGRTSSYGAAQLVYAFQEALENKRSA